MTKLLTTAILIISPLAFIVSADQLTENQVSETDDYVTIPTIVTTESKFEDREETITTSIPFKTEYKENSNLEYRQENVIQEGGGGTLTETYLISFWEDEEIGRDLIKSETDPPTNEIVERGTKITWKTLSTEQYGDLDYWYKLNAFATSYDGNCAGCRGLTYSGTLVKYGVCAVDPKVIPLGTNFYVEGYGLCRSEDIGGAIKGNKVDLGFEDVRNGFWSARYTDVYLLTNSPN